MQICKLGLQRVATGQPAVPASSCEIDIFLSMVSAAAASVAGVCCGEQNASLLSLTTGDWGLASRLGRDSSNRY